MIDPRMFKLGQMGAQSNIPAMAVPSPGAPPMNPPTPMPAPTAAMMPQQTPQPVPQPAMANVGTGPAPAAQPPINPAMAQRMRAMGGNTAGAAMGQPSEADAIRQIAMAMQRRQRMNQMGQMGQ